MTENYLSPPQNPAVLLSPWLSDCYSHNGQNKLLVPIQAVIGNVNNPGLSFQGHEKSGWWVDESTDPANLVLSIFGKEVARFDATTGLLIFGVPVTSSSNTWSELEVPSGIINGSNTIFTTAHLIHTTSGPTDSSAIKVYVNGVLQRPTTDYSLSSANTITLHQAPEVTDNLYVDYILAPT